MQWRRPQVSAYSIVVLDYSQQFYPRRDGSASPVCDGLFPAPSWWFQGALSSIPNHCGSHTWDATHGTHMVRMHVLGDAFEIILTYLDQKYCELRNCQVKSKVQVFWYIIYANSSWYLTVLANFPGKSYQ